MALMPRSCISQEILAFFLLWFLPLASASTGISVPLMSSSEISSHVCLFSSITLDRPSRILPTFGTTASATATSVPLPYLNSMPREHYSSGLGSSDDDMALMPRFCISQDSRLREGGTKVVCCLTRGAPKGPNLPRVRLNHQDALFPGHGLATHSQTWVLQWLLHLVRPWPPLGHLSLLSKMVSCCTISSYFFLCSSNSAFHSSPKLPYLSLNLGSLFLLSSQLSRHAPYLTFPFPGHLHHIRFGPLIHISDLRLELNPLLPLYPYLPLRLLNRIRPFPSYSPKTKFYLLATPTADDICGAHSSCDIRDPTSSHRPDDVCGAHSSCDIRDPTSSHRPDDVCGAHLSCDIRDPTSSHRPDDICGAHSSCDIRDPTSSHRPDDVCGARSSCDIPDPTSSRRPDDICGAHSSCDIRDPTSSHRPDDVCGAHSSCDIRDPTSSHRPDDVCGAHLSCDIRDPTSSHRPDDICGAHSSCDIRDPTSSHRPDDVCGAHSSCDIRDPTSSHRPDDVCGAHLSCDIRDPTSSHRPDDVCGAHLSCDIRDPTSSHRPDICGACSSCDIRDPTSSHRPDDVCGARSSCDIPDPTSSRRPDDVCGAHSSCDIRDPTSSHRPDSFRGVWSSYDGHWGPAISHGSDSINAANKRACRPWLFHAYTPQAESIYFNCHGIKFEPGILGEVFVLLKAKVSHLREEERKCVLMIDEMAIQDKFEYDTSTGCIRGWTTLTVPGVPKDTLRKATHALVFMLGGASSR
ncbi:hypothetical protein ISCGN_002946 [Ixodes scapularis]